MRNYLSVFSLFISRSFGKAIALLAALTTGEFALFMYYLNSENVVKNEYLDGGGKDYLLGIEYILSQNKMLTVFLAAGFVGLTVMLCLTGCKFSGKQGYTLRRLNLNEKRVLLCQSAYGTAVYGIFFMLQAAVFFLFYVIYVSYASEHENTFSGLISNQTVFLAFYRSGLLHGLLPLEDILKYISSLIMIITLGFSTASFSYLMRRKKFPYETVLLVPIILINFTGDWTELTYDFIIMGMSLFVIGSLITRISREGQAYDG